MRFTKLKPPLRMALLETPERFLRVPAICAGIAAGIALLALLGWVSGMRFLAGEFGTYISMAPSTALAFLLLSVVLFHFVDLPRLRPGRLFAQVAVSIVLLIALSVLVQFIFDIDFGIEQVLSRTNVLVGSTPLGRMSPLTAGAFLLEGAAFFIWLSGERWQNLPTAVALLAAAATAINIVVLMGYAFGAPLLYGGTTIPVALPTAMAFVLIGIGQFYLAAPGIPALREWSGASMRGILLRAFLPVFLFFILLDSWMGPAFAPIMRLNLAVWYSFKALTAGILIVIITAWIARRTGGEIERAQKALAESETRYRSLFENMHSGYVHCQMLFEDGKPQDFIYLDVNDAFRELTGLTDAAGKRMSELIPSVQESNPELFEICGRVALTGRPEKFETYIPALGIWFAISVYSPKKGYFVAVFDNITERKRAAEEVAWLASFPQQNPNPVVEIDSTGTVFYANPAAQHTFPDLKAQGLKHPWLAGLEDVIARFQQEGRGELQREIQIGNAWYSQPLYYVHEAARLRVYGTEITERKLAEQQTVQMKRLYATLSQVNQAIVRVKSGAELYQTLCDMAVQFGEFALAWIGLLDESTGDIRPVAANGADIAHWPFPLTNGLADTAIRTSKVVTSHDLQTDEWAQRLQDQIQKHDFHSAASVPFRLRGKILGVLNLVSHERDFFEAEEEVHLLEEMGLDISFALDNMETEVERKQAEKALRESEARFRLLFENNHTVMMLIEPVSGAIKNANLAATEFYGYPLSELCAMNINDINQLAPDEVQAERMRALKEERNFFNFQHRLANGEIRSVEVHSAPIELDGQTLLFSIVYDTTERRRTEDALRSSQAQMAAIFNSAMDAIVSTDANQRILIFNRAAEAMFRCSQSEAIGQPLERFIPVRFRVIHSQHVKNFAQTGETNRGMGHLGIISGLRNDGEEFPIEASISKINLSGNELFTVILRDVTERKQAEEQIQRQLRHLNALRMIDIAISSSFDLNIILDVVLQQVLAQLRVDAGAITLFNPQMQTIEYTASRGFRSNALQHTQLKLGEGYASQAVLQRRTIHISGLMESGGKLAKALKLAKEEFVDYYGTPLIVKGEVKGVLEIYHHSHLRADSEWLEFLEALAGQAAIAIDNAQLFENLQRSNLNLEHRVTERTAELNRTNAELEHANQIKDEFLANMSHELRTPLTSILGLSESLLEEKRGSLSDHQQRSVRIIESSGRHLLELINDILDLSKIEAGKFDFYPQPLAVDEICRSSLSFVKSQAAKKSITVTYVNEAAVPKIFADPRRLKQILVNLLNNAVKFTPENGTVTLQVTCAPTEERIQFAVIDTGIGISRQNLKRLFQPFVQVDSRLNRQHEGTGLGLALVQRLTDLHGGSVKVESEVGQGSRFTISLACRLDEIAKLETFQAQATPGARQKAEKSEMPSQVTPRGVVLLAEDNMANVLTIGEYLKSHQYEVVIAHDGLEAIKLAGDVNPDIILMDIQMPSMNGLEAIAHLRDDSRFAATPIIALTALAMPGDRERSLLAGATEYMSKPVNLSLLATTIKELLGKQV